MSADNYLFVEMMPKSDTEAGVWHRLASDDDGSADLLRRGDCIFVGTPIEAMEFADDFESRNIVEYGQVIGFRLKEVTRRALRERQHGR